MIDAPPPDGGPAHQPAEQDDERLDDVDETLLETLLDDELPDGDAVLEPVSDPIATARRRHGAAGAALAAGMFGVDIALGRKPREDIPVVVAASDQPIDIDTDGIVVQVDPSLTVVAPAIPRRDARPAPRRRRARRSPG